MHRVLRLTVTAVAVTDELAEDCYRAVSLVGSRGGPYAAIFDFSGVTSTPLSPNTVRALAAARPAIPGGRPRAFVAREPAAYGLARMFELSRDSMGGQLQVVRSLEEAYNLLGVRPEDFTHRVVPQDRAA